MLLHREVKFICKESLLFFYFNWCASEEKGLSELIHDKKVKYHKVRDPFREDHRCPLIEHASYRLSHRLSVETLVTFALNEWEDGPLPVNLFRKDTTERLIEKRIA